MVDVTTYSEARQNLAKLLDRVVADNEPVIVARKKRGSVVLVSLAEWNSIQETLHLSSTRANARALRDAIDQAERGEYAKEMTMAELRAFARGQKSTSRRKSRKVPPAASSRGTRAVKRRKSGIKVAGEAAE